MAKSGESSDDEDAFMEDDTPSHPFDPTYEPSSQEESDGECDLKSKAKTPDTGPVKTRKYIVFEDKLDELFSHCRQCHLTVIKIDKKEKGSLLIVQTVCENGHNLRWHSQPAYGRGNAVVGVGTWLLSAAILFSGGLFSTFSLFSHLLNLCFIGKSTFFDNQQKILCRRK